MIIKNRKVQACIPSKYSTLLLHFKIVRKTSSHQEILIKMEEAHGTSHGSARDLPKKRPIKSVCEKKQRKDVVLSKT